MKTAFIACLAASASALIAPPAMPATKARAVVTAPQMALVEEGSFVPDMERRNIMNLVLLFGGVLPAVGGLAIPYVLFFIPAAAAAAAAACRPSPRPATP